LFLEIQSIATREVAENQFGGTFCIARVHGHAKHLFLLAISLCEHENHLDALSPDISNSQQFVAISIRVRPVTRPVRHPALAGEESPEIHLGKSNCSFALAHEIDRNLRTQLSELAAPNVSAHRPRASDAWHATETQSRGSVQPVCYAWSISDSWLSFRGLNHRHQRTEKGQPATAMKSMQSHGLRPRIFASRNAHASDQEKSATIIA